MLCHRRCDRWPGAGSLLRFPPNNHPGETSPDPPGSGGTVSSVHSPAHGLWLNWSPGQHPAVESSQKTQCQNRQSRNRESSSSSPGLWKVFQPHGWSQEASGRFLLENRPLPVLPKVTCNLELDSCLGSAIRLQAQHTKLHLKPINTNRTFRNWPPINSAKSRGFAFWGSRKGAQQHRYLKALVLAAVQLLLIGSLLGAHKSGVFRPGWKWNPGII